ncbi:MAG: restriction endonuclease subunit S [Burkholderiaceae bacterium]|jgi:hypothetical protein
MIKLSDLFEVHYGVNLELVRLPRQTNGINFVSRTAKNNGVSAVVAPIIGVTQIPSGVITVAGGGAVLEAFLQPEPFYSGRDLYYLVPKFELSTAQKLYYCACIRANKYRYNYGRQANRTLRDIMLPEISDIPKYVTETDLSIYDGAANSCGNEPTPSLNTANWKPFEFQELFSIARGVGPRRSDLDGTGTTPFVTSSDSNNGCTGVTSMAPLHLGNTIGVNRNGSVGEAFYQPEPFCSTEDVHIFTPKFKLNVYIALFLTTLIRQEKYRFGYGRKWGIERMKISTIRLPITEQSEPDWQYMENYIKTLPYSSQLK